MVKTADPDEICTGESPFRILHKSYRYRITWYLLMYVSKQSSLDPLKSREEKLKYHLDLLSFLDSGKDWSYFTQALNFLHEDLGLSRARSSECLDRSYSNYFWRRRRGNTTDYPKSLAKTVQKLQTSDLIRRKNRIPS